MDLTICNTLEFRLNELIKIKLKGAVFDHKL